MKQLRQDARAIFAAALRAADPVEATKRHVRVKGEGLWVGARHYDLSKYNDVLVVGAGKASARIALAIEELLGERIAGGLVIVKRGYSVPLRKIEVVEAGHPVPDEAGVKATEKIIGLLRHTGERNLVVCPISGGGSALLSCPMDLLSLADKQQTTRALLICGAKIQEMNAVRKHISKVKGGRLARLAYPSTVVSLILSDIIGDPIDSIASGPTAPDRSTFADCLRLLERCGVHEKIPPAVRDFLTRGARGEVEETPKSGDAVFEKVHNAIIGNNQLALSAAKQCAEALGYNPWVLSSSIEGEAREVAVNHATIAKEIISAGRPVQRPACVISGGETTVSVRGNGLGGRNQEFALSIAIEIAGMEGIVALCGGTDGTDGPTEAAGGIVDGTTTQRAKENGFDARDYLDRNDSYHFLEAVDDLLLTGPTFTNVMDLCLILLA